MEIERKFKLSSIPEEVTSGGEKTPIIQGYLYIGKGELRIRKKGNICYFTIKGDGTVARFELEIKIFNWLFNFLWLMTKGCRIEKTRYTFIYEDKNLEIDEYYWDLTGLFTLECEFSSENEAHKFELPEWIKDSIEVTLDKRYKNKNLAIYGMPRN